MRKPSAPASGPRARWLLLFSATLFATLTIAATSQASSGIVGYFLLGDEYEGALQAPAEAKTTDVAVNASGTGGASPGDVYVLGRGVRQLSASDDLIRLSGGDAVKSGPGQADETQAVRVDATTGSFKLGFGAETTADIAANASAAQVESALAALPSIGPGGASVSGGPGDAGGTAPYIVSFDGGSLAGTNQPPLSATNGTVPLSGGDASISAYTLNQGSNGYEICQPADGDECQDSGSGDRIAIDQVSGDAYVTVGSSLRKYSATGEFIRAWGNDVVVSGPDDSSVNEQKSVTVVADGGTFTLGYREELRGAVESTPPLPYNTSVAAVETALDDLAGIGGNYSSVSVTKEESSGLERIYRITFHGLLGGDDLGDGNQAGVLVSNPKGLTIGSGEKSATIEDIGDGGGYEICNLDDACRLGSPKDLPGSLAVAGTDLAVAPAGTPNAGNVLLAAGSNYRVQEYSPEGAFVRTFGWDVDATDPSTGFEVCSIESGHTCKEGSPGAGVGQFGSPNKLRGVDEDSSGDIYTVEIGSQNYTALGNRVQKFTPAGGLDLTPSPFGTSETQALRVNAGAGQFRLTFDSERGGTRGTGDITEGSAVVTNLNTSEGEFAVGQQIATAIQGGTGLAPGTTIVALGTNTLTLSNPIRQFENVKGKRFVSNRPYRTTNLPYNASAAEVEAALNALPSINFEGASVSVSGGPGDSSGSNPYLISFEGGLLARTDPGPIEASDGATPLSGGVGVGANTASVTTTIPGGPGGSYPGPFTSSELDHLVGSEPLDIAVGPGGHVFVSKAFPLGAAKCADGSSAPGEIRVQELDSSGTVLGTSDPCSGVEGFSPGQFRPAALTVNPITGHPYLLTQNLNSEPPRLNVFGPPGPPPALALEAISKIGASGGTISGTVDPNGPGTGYPETTGTPGATKTTYRVEYKKSSESDWTAYTPDIPVGNGTSPAPFSVGVAGLDPNTEYELKVVAVKPFTATVEEAKSFMTLPAGPEIEALSSSNVALNSADLNAVINPRGLASSYHFEYGTTPAYGSSTPETSFGESHDAQSVQDHIEGLQDAVYHFRVVSTNPSGTTTSADQTFTFHPPVCPNQTVRQQTGAAYLPDCRAYELVSPEDAGGTTLYTGGPQSPYATNPPRLAFVGQIGTVPGSGRTPMDTAGDLYVASRSASGWSTRYVGPSAEEAGCAGGRPLVDGTGPPSKIQNDVMADPGLDRIVDWNLGNPLECAWGWFGGVRFKDQNTAALGSNAPYVWSAHGDFLDRWPTSAGDVAGGEENFSCPQDPSKHPYPEGFFANIPVSYFCSTFVDASKDLSHFVFSTKSGLFGEGGLSAAPGSAYDNDTADNTLELISKLPGGGPIPQEPGAKAGSDELIRFPSVSADGSHILMGTATKPACKYADFPGGAQGFRGPLCPLVTQPTHLYMRVNDALTYDVSGAPVLYIGATPDGTKVYFTSDEQLTGDDTDTSTDLYMWSENGGVPQLTRISAGETDPIGNTDDCASSWTSECDIKTYSDSAISAAAANQGGAGSWTTENPNPGYTDNAIAAKSGDIYFYSPEQLVDGKGVPGKENLYVYRQGSVRYVAALGDDPYCLPGSTAALVCSEGAAGRLQVTPDGRFAAFVTTSNVTAYDSHGFAEMYRYDAESEEVTCVSCHSDGSAALDDVRGSQGGRFLTDDGRVFFATTEALVERDSNAGLDRFGRRAGSDVYEFVEGRPQLISSGTGTSELGSAQSQPGLYGVSADGVDVYFGTTDTLVGQDRNGEQMKFYDARTNGGFSFVPAPAPCAAADECHGLTLAPPPPLASGTGAALGAGGNAPAAGKKAKHKKRKQRKHKRGSQRATKQQRGGAR